MKKIIFISLIALTFFSCNDTTYETVKSNIKKKFPDCTIYNQPSYKYKFVVVTKDSDLYLVDCQNIGTQVGDCYYITTFKKH